MVYRHKKMVGIQGLRHAWSRTTNLMHAWSTGLRGYVEYRHKDMI